KKLEELKKQAREQGGSGKKPDKKDVLKAWQDLASNDSKKQEEARETLDKAGLKKDREKFEQLKKDLKSNDPEKRAAAENEVKKIEQEIDEWRKQNSKDDMPLEPDQL